MTELAESVKKRNQLICRIRQKDLTTEELVVEIARLKVFNHGLHQTLDHDIWQLIFSFQESFNKNRFGRVSIDGYRLEEPTDLIPSDNKLSIVLNIVCLQDTDSNDKADIREIFLGRLYGLKEEINRLSFQYGVEFVISGEFV